MDLAGLTRAFAYLEDQGYRPFLFAVNTMSWYCLEVELRADLRDDTLWGARRLISDEVKDGEIILWGRQGEMMKKVYFYPETHTVLEVDVDESPRRYQESGPSKL